MGDERCRFEVEKERLKTLDTLHIGPDALEDEELEARFAALVRTDNVIDPTCDFLHKHQDIYEKSLLFQVMRIMPKGALLHTHGIATGHAQRLFDFLHHDKRVFVDVKTGTIQYLSKDMVRDNHRPFKEMEFPEFQDLVVLDQGLTRAERWPEFIALWDRVRFLSDTIPVWDGEKSFFWMILEDLFDSGVVYCELKQLVPEKWILPSADGSKIDYADGLVCFMDVFKKTLDEFKDQHPEFIGCKVIWCSLKIFPPAKIQQDIDMILDVMESHAEYVAGYDLVGHEDTLKPIALYKEELAYYKAKGGYLVLHAGETITNGAEGLYDAIAIGAERLGHGYALPKHPGLMQVVKDRGIVVECCPISNQVLGYCPDLRNHPGLVMLNNGVKISISHDDPLMFGYCDVSFDFAVITKAWGLTLGRLRQLTRQSFSMSTLKCGQVQQAEQAFDQAWAKFLSTFNEMTK